MRIAGAQIPVTNNVSKNYEAIKKACDWAIENNVDYLFTPENALSGYVSDYNINTCKETEEAMENLVKYVSNKKLGLIVGTQWLDDKDTFNEGVFGFKSNQLRFYNQEGEYIGSTKKTKVVSFDEGCIAETKVPVMTLTKGQEKLKIGALICNDLVGNYYDGGINLARRLKDEQVALIIHASNTQKDQGPPVKLIHDNFHNACIQFVSYATNTPILTVDNPWHIHGVESKDGTSFTSGIYLPLEAKYQAPKTGTQYFYYDEESSNYGCYIEQEA
jgi:predicted amidohydrolase